MNKTLREILEDMIEEVRNNQIMHRESEVRIANALSGSLADSILESEKIRGQIANASSSASPENEITITTANTPVKVEIPTKNGLIVELNADISSLNGCIVTTSPKEQTVFVTSTLVKTGNTATTYNTYIAKNGTIIEQSAAIMRASNTSDKRQVVNQIMVTAKSGDEFNVYIENADNTQNATIDSFILIVSS